MDAITVDSTSSDSDDSTSSGDKPPDTNEFVLRGSVVQPGQIWALFDSVGRPTWFAQITAIYAARHAAPHVHRTILVAWLDIRDRNARTFSLTGASDAQRDVNVFSHLVDARPCDAACTVLRILPQAGQVWVVHNAEYRSVVWFAYVCGRCERDDSRYRFRYLLQDDFSANDNSDDMTTFELEQGEPRVESLGVFAYSIPFQLDRLRNVFRIHCDYTDIDVDSDSSDSDTEDPVASAKSARHLAENDQMSDTVPERKAKKPRVGKVRERPQYDRVVSVSDSAVTFGVQRDSNDHVEQISLSEIDKTPALCQALSTFFQLRALASRALRQPSGVVAVHVTAEHNAKGIAAFDRTVYRWHDNMKDFGVTVLHNVFSEPMLAAAEQSCEALCDKGVDGVANAATMDRTFRGDRLKYFFGYRYSYGKDSTQSGGAQLYTGVDPVDSQPWLAAVRDHLVRNDIIRRQFVDQIVVNVYMQSGAGLGVHMDSKELFERPIVSVRLFGPSALSFGAKGQGASDPLLTVPQERGCVCIMSQFAADSIKHAVRARDVTQKTASLMLRKMKSKAILNAIAYNSAKSTSKGTSLRGCEVRNTQFRIAGFTTPNHAHFGHIKLNFAPIAPNSSGNRNLPHESPLVRAELKRAIAY